MPKSKFKREKRNGVTVSVLKIAGGGEVRRDGKEFQAYDATGHYLGFTADQSQAEYMALYGYPNHMDNASDLSLWVMWNDAVDSGVKVYECEAEQQQFLSLGGKVVMSAMEDANGWDVELLDEHQFWETWGSERFPKDILGLTIAKKPFVLE